VVPDVREEIIEVIKQVAARADAVLVSGGLGPTSDDFTAECAAKAPASSWSRAPPRFSTSRPLREAGADRHRQQPAPGDGARRAEVVLNTALGADVHLATRRLPPLLRPRSPTEYRHLVDTEVLPRLTGGETRRVLCCSR